MLKFEKVSKVYRTDFVETYALRDLDLEVRKGEFVAVTGPSGSGKTTFLTVAGMLASFDSGAYLLDGIDVTSMDERHRCRLRNEKIGFVFQAFNLVPDLNVINNVELPLRYRGLPRSTTEKLASEALGKVGLSGRAKHFPSQLSGGQQQRVAIARAIAGSPRLILADEPTGNLDSEMARAVMDLLKQLHDEGTTIVMVTHEPSLAARAQRIYKIVDGIGNEMAMDPAQQPVLEFA